MSIEQRQYKDCSFSNILQSLDFKKVKIKMKLFTALSMLFGAQACTAGGQCSCQTRGFSKTTALDGTYCYTRVADPVSYDEAKAACIQLNENATLPLVNSAEDLVAWSDLTSNRFADSFYLTNDF